jgi:hypothetical protein
MELLTKISMPVWVCVLMICSVAYTITALLLRNAFRHETIALMPDIDVIASHIAAFEFWVIVFLVVLVVYIMNV